MKRYEVRYLVRVVMEVEADNKDDARDAAARVFGGLRGLDGIRLGAATFEGVVEAGDDEDEEDQWEWRDE